MNNFIKKTGATTLAMLCALAPVSSLPVFAATSGVTTNNTAVSKDLEDNDIIDYNKTASLRIHKYDITAAEAAGDYTEGTRIANGKKDATLETTMKKYAVEGVQFTYLRVGNIETYSNTADGKTNVEVVYEIPTRLAEILKLSKDEAYNMNGNGVAKKCTTTGVYHYTSTQLSKALAKILEEDNLAAKSTLEEYLYSYGTQDDTNDQNVNTDGSTNVSAVNMTKTDANGETYVDGLKLGLYLVMETEVPEQVTSTCNPWFASLPFTNITDTEATDLGGNYWVYDMNCYPKNQTGNPTLDKSVRNAYNGTSSMADKNGTVNKGDEYVYDKKSGTGSLVVFNNDTNAENTADTNEKAYIANRGGYTSDGTTAGKDGAGYSYDFEYRDTTTASAGDVLDYILVSKLPHITSKATFLSEYTFTDVLSAGLTYNRDVKIAFYDNPTDANANNTKNAVVTWDATPTNHNETYMDVTITDEGTGHQWKDGSQQMTVKLTEAGLNIINGEGVNGTNQVGQGGNSTSKNSLSDMYMVVYYTATVNSNASLVLGDDGNENDVILTWGRTSDGYYNTLEDRNYVYSYSLDLTKTFSDQAGDMSKVQFKLYNSTDAYYVNAEKSDEDGVYYVTGKAVDKAAATTFTPDENGKIIVYGLEADTYGMTEISTDNGYTLLEDSIMTTITPTDREINASVAGTTGMDKTAIDAIVQAYHGGIYDENGDLVTASKDKIFDKDGNRPTIQDANGRSIGKTDMYVSEVKPATATVDKVKADMKAHEYTKGEMTEKHTSADATVVLSVVNNKNFVLPQTGGYGTIIFTLAGCAAALGGVLIVTKKSKKKTA